jgi:hypothetical protein
MEVNPEKAKAAKACFDFNPLINTIFVTSNLSCFLKRNDAVNHARGLDDKEIDVFIRSNDDPVIDADQTDSVTEESENVPDARLAVVKAGGGGKGKNFTKAAKPVDTPAPDAIVDTPAPDAIVDAPAPDAIVDTPAPDAIVDTPAPDAIVDAPAPDAVVDTPAPDAIVDAPAPDAIVDTPAPDAIVDAPAPDKTIGEDIVKELNHLVDEVETALHLKDKE